MEDNPGVLMWIGVAVGTLLAIGGVIALGCVAVRWLS